MFGDRHALTLKKKMRKNESTDDGTGTYLVGRKEKRHLSAGFLTFRYFEGTVVPPLISQKFTAIKTWRKRSFEEKGLWKEVNQKETKKKKKKKEEAKFGRK